MRIHQNSAFLSQLVKEVQRGLLAPAAFQRPYVWSQDDVLALCQSVLAGFPLGGFLCWAPGRHADISKVGRGRLGPIVPPEGATIEKLLLDGQNRLATIAWLLRDDTMPYPLDMSPMEADTWCGGKVLVADLANKVLRFERTEACDDGFTLPSRCLFRSTDAMSLVRSRWNTTWSHLDEAAKDAGLTWYDKAVDAFCEARVVETVLENASVQEAKNAFLHICKVGVPMSEVDFDNAVSWAQGS